MFAEQIEKVPAAAAFTCSLRSSSNCHYCVALLNARGNLCYRNAAWQQLSQHSLVLSELAEDGEVHPLELYAAFTPSRSYIQALTRYVACILQGTQHTAEYSFTCTCEEQKHQFQVRMDAYIVQGKRGVMIQQYILPDHCCENVWS